MSHLFIPEKIKVGYQKRQGTYTDKLAYVIYYDEKGKLRKQTSWENWRDNNIEAEEFDNKPQDNIVLNKSVQRYNWSHFGSNRSMIRIYDPRGIEFEITPYNLIGLLMETDCNKRMLDGKFVYAWQGTELILLPCGSESYKEAVEHTARQSQKVGARTLIQGCSYTMKNGQEVIYIGRFPWHEWNPRTSKDHGRETKRQHVFWNGYDFENFPSCSRLSFINSEEPVQEYAELVQKLEADIRTQVITGWETTPIEIPKNFNLDEYGRIKEKNRNFFVLEGNKINVYHLTVKVDRNWDRINNQYSKYIIKEYYIDKDKELDINTLKVADIYNERYHFYRHHRTTNNDRPRDSIKENHIFKTEEELREFLTRFQYIDAILGSGKKYRMKKIGFRGMPGQR